ncbi:MAG TPA: N-formylglutamate deformylase [Casimicrobiaceae bacterium]|nr:N-formylglutamate deformylase [Casimicrobiaceae bacterium]
MDATYTLHRGTAPLLVSVPHCATALPGEVRDALGPRAHAVEDADWHLDRLYDFVRARGASFLVPRYARYAIDLNRPPDDTPMYPGASNTGLCPVTFFDGTPLYADARAPDAAAIATRRERWWQPYHDALAAELDAIRARHGHAVLFDGHSIRSRIPWLFEGKLPDFNLGTASGASCAPSLRDAAVQALTTPEFTLAVDGRFKGGYITRRYGRPAERIHAIQLEMCQSTYMDETPPFAYDEARAARLLPHLRRLVDALLAWTPDR